MAYCRNCGAEMPANAKFCSECGQDRSVSVPQDQRIQTEDVPVPPPANRGEEEEMPRQKGSLSTYRRPIIGIVVLLGLIYIASQQNATKPVTIQVLGDKGTPYEITYENSQGSHTDQGTVPSSYTIDVLTRPSADDYVKARASKLPGADNLKPTEGDLVNVDLQLVAQDGTVLDEARGDGLFTYSLNTTSVEVDGEDVR